MADTKDDLRAVACMRFVRLDLPNSTKMDNTNSPNMIVLTAMIDRLIKTALTCGTTKTEIAAGFLTAIAQMTDVSTVEKREQALNLLMTGLRGTMERLDQISKRAAS